MKNNFAPPKRKYLGRSGFWLILFLAMNLTFFSCVTEEPPSTALVTEVETDQAVEDARAWFGPQEEFVVKNDFGPAAKAKTRIKKIHWDRAITHENGRVIEVEIGYSLHGVPITGEKSPERIQQKQTLAFFRLILEKAENGGYEKYLMKYFPESAVAHQKELETNNYERLSERFTGKVLVYNWDEDLVKGWEIEGGQILHFFRSREVRKGKNGANLAEDCQNYTELICESYPINGEIVIECTESPVVECSGYPDDTGGNPGGPGWSGSTPPSTGPSLPGGGGGSGGGSGNVTVDDPIGYELPFENFVLDQNPSTINWRLSSPSQRFMHLVSHIKRAKDQGVNSLNIKSIFTAWPANIEANGHIKSFYANLNYLGKQIRVYYEMPVAEPWTSINPFGSRVSNDRDECVIEYTRDIGNLRTAYFLFNDNNLCSYFENYLL